MNIMIIYKRCYFLLVISHVLMTCRLGDSSDVHKLDKKVANVYTNKNQTEVIFNEVCVDVLSTKFEIQETQHPNPGCSRVNELISLDIIDVSGLFIEESVTEESKKSRKRSISDLSINRYNTVQYKESEEIFVQNLQSKKSEIVLKEEFKSGKEALTEDLMSQNNETNNFKDSKEEVDILDLRLHDKKYETGKSEEFDESSISRLECQGSRIVKKKVKSALELFSKKNKIFKHEEFTEIQKSAEQLISDLQYPHSNHSGSKSHDLIINEKLENLNSITCEMEKSKKAGEFSKVELTSQNTIELPVKIYKHQNKQQQTEEKIKESNYSPRKEMSRSDINDNAGSSYITNNGDIEISRRHKIIKLESETVLAKKYLRRSQAITDSELQLTALSIESEDFRGLQTPLIDALENPGLRMIENVPTINRSLTFILQRKKKSFIDATENLRKRLSSVFISKAIDTHTMDAVPKNIALEITRFNEFLYLTNPKNKLFTYEINLRNISDFLTEGKIALTSVVFDSTHEIRIFALDQISEQYYLNIIDSARLRKGIIKIISQPNIKFLWCTFNKMKFPFIHDITQRLVKDKYKILNYKKKCWIAELSEFVTFVYGAIVELTILNRFIYFSIDTDFITCHDLQYPNKNEANYLRKIYKLSLPHGINGYLLFKYILCSIFQPNIFNLGKHTVNSGVYIRTTTI